MCFIYRFFHVFSFLLFSPYKSCPSAQPEGMTFVFSQSSRGRHSKCTVLIISRLFSTLVWTSHPAVGPTSGSLA